jgi:hypothetical protein
MMDSISKISKISENESPSKKKKDDLSGIDLQKLNDLI